MILISAPTPAMENAVMSKELKNRLKFRLIGDCRKKYVEHDALILNSTHSHRCIFCKTDAVQMPERL